MRTDDTELRLADLYPRYGASVLQRCQRLLADESAAWDAMHETFIRAVRYHGSFRGESRLGWLLGIALRVCLDELARRRRLERPEAVMVSDATTASPEAAVGQQRTVAWLLPLFGRDIQQIVVLRFFDDMEIQEISEVTGLSERTVARRLQKFLDRARRLMEDR